jgi:hypothetical protein
MSPLRHPRSAARLCGEVVVLCVLAAVLAAAPAGAVSDNSAEPPTASRDGAVESTIGDSALADLVTNPSHAPPGTKISVEVHGPDSAALRSAISTHGGTSYGEVPGYFVEARIPVDKLAVLAESSAVTRLSKVTVSSGTAPQNTQTLQANSALTAIVEDTVQLRPWHELGHRGAGQRIGILDIFGTSELERAIADGRLPAPAGAFCRHFGRTCPITSTNTGPHGVGVAEIIHRIAPDAQLYLATVTTLGDLSAAIDWFSAQGVTVINRSETSEFDGPGDGTGPLGSLVDRAVAKDMVWVAAAGNAGGDSVRNGQNWVGAFNDPDGNGIHNWASGAERMEFTCGFLLGMRWDDWDGNSIATDYDLWIYDGQNDTQPEARATDTQNDVVHRPLERIVTQCSGASDLDYLSIVKFEDLQPDGNDQIQIMGNFTPMKEWINAGSATGPGADSASPGAITVGATVRPSSAQLAGYSSQGPTFDGRINIDLLGPSCLPVTDFAGCFSGTSASAPTITGVLAVLRGANVFLTASGADAVISRITTDGGTPGPDAQYGHGSLSLPSPSVLGARDTLPTCRGVPATIVGTKNDDLLTGTAARDVIFAGRGNDTIDGLGGNDLICGGFGEDVIFAGAGNDVVFSGPGHDRVRGGDGADMINGGHGHDDIEGNKGADVVRGFTGRDYVKGGLGNDEVFGGAGNDRLVGGDGTDKIFGGNGVDRCRPPVETAVSCRP